MLELPFIWSVLKAIWFEASFFLYGSGFVQKMISIIINVPFWEPYHWEIKLFPKCLDFVQ